MTFLNARETEPKSMLTLVSRGGASIKILSNMESEELEQMLRVGLKEKLVISLTEIPHPDALMQLSDAYLPVSHSVVKMEDIFYFSIIPFVKITGVDRENKQSNIIKPGLLIPRQ